MKRSPARPKLERIRSFDMISLKKPVMPSSLICRSLFIRLSSSRRAITFNYYIGCRAAQTDDHSRQPAKHRIRIRPDGVPGAARESDCNVDRHRSRAGSADRSYRGAARPLEHSMDHRGTRARRVGTRRGHDYSAAPPGSAAPRRTAVSAYFSCCLIQAAAGAKTLLSDFVPTNTSRWPQLSSLVNEGSGAPVDFADSSTRAGHCAPKLVLANAITGILEALSDASTSGVNGFSPS